MKYFSLLMLLLLSACASTPQKPQQTFFPVNQADVLLPATPAAFVKGDVHVYPQPELGYAIRYAPSSGADAHLDVYIYPLVLPQEFSLADALEGHFNSALKEISMANPSAQVKNISVLGGAEAGVKTAALKATVELYAQGSQKSFLYLTVLDDVLIKARFTEKTSGGLEKQVDEFFLTLMKDTHFANPASHKHPYSQTILVGGAMAQEEPGSFMTYALGYLMGMQKSIEQGSYLNTFERELNAVDSGLALTAEAMAGKQKENKPSEPAKIYPNAQIAQMVKIQKAGFLREYVWELMRRPYWQQPSDLKLNACKAWMQTNLPDHKGLPGPPVTIGWETSGKNKSEK